MFFPVHFPLLLHVRLVAPNHKYPLSQENWQVSPGRLEHGFILPLAGADNWGQRNTNSGRKNDSQITIGEPGGEQFVLCEKQLGYSAEYIKWESSKGCHTRAQIIKIQ